MVGDKFLIIEKYIFGIFILINLCPVFSGFLFPTLDGPSHLYNANIINKFLFGNPEYFKKFLIFNTELVPNWIGHFSLCIFNTFLPSHISEKFLVTIYLIGLPLTYRYLIQSILIKNNVWLCYFIFPFSYSTLFLMGFYNFSLGLIFLFLGIGYWIKNYNKALRLKSAVFLFFIMFASYFSHAFIFGILISILIAYSIFNFLFIEKKSFNNMVIKKVLHKLLILIITSSFFLILLFNFFYERKDNTNFTFIEKTKLFESFLKLQPIIALNALEKQNYTYYLFGLLAVLFVIVLFAKIFQAFKEKKTSLTNFSFWAFINSFLLVLYFFMPDTNSGGGLITDRFGILFFLFFPILLANHKFKIYTGISTVVLLFCFNAIFVSKYYFEIKKLSAVAEKYYQLGNIIQDNTTLLSINFHENWLFAHYSDYIGAQKSVIILDNYEWNTGFFPLKYNENNFPKISLDQTNDYRLCNPWKSKDSNKEIKIDYILVSGRYNTHMNEDCIDSFRKAIANYELISSSTEFLLFKRKL